MPRRTAGAIILALGLLLVLLAARELLSSSGGSAAAFKHNRTWLEFAWVNNPVSEDGVRQLGERLDENAIDVVYLEVSAWRTDGTLLEGQYVAEFIDMLRTASPDLTILAWLRMSADQIADEDQQAAILAVADKAVHQWGADGVQLNGLSVRNSSNSYVTLVRDLRTTIGDDMLLSVTVPPDRIPTDPDVPIGSTSDPDLTWDVNYKQRVGLLLVDEMVIMAHASGLENSEDYEAWVAYQLGSYLSALAELEEPIQLVMAVPTYDAAPEHDPAVETLGAAIDGVKRGIKNVSNIKDWMDGIGLFEYKTTDSREWVVYQESWLGKKTD